MLENSIRYTNKGGSINITVREERDTVFIAISMILTLFSGYRRDYKPTRICSTSLCAAVFGRRYPDVKIIAESILQYVAKQIMVNPKEYNRNSQREAAKYEQLEEERFVKNRMVLLV